MTEAQEKTQEQCVEPFLFSVLVHVVHDFLNSRGYNFYTVVRLGVCVVRCCPVETQERLWGSLKEQPRFHAIFFRVI